MGPGGDGGGGDGGDGGDGGVVVVVASCFFETLTANFTGKGGGQDRKMPSQTAPVRNNLFMTMYAAPTQPYS